MPQTHPPLHQKLSDDFRARITSGEWPEGSALPSEASLCAEYGTSRGPIRQALAALRAEGAISGGRGKPPVIQRAVPTQPFTTFLSFTEWAQSVNKTPGQRTIELARRPATAIVAHELGLQPAEPVVEVLRLRYLDAAPTMIERSSFVASIGRLLFDFDTDSGSIFEFLGTHGVDLYRARHTIDAVAANESDAELLQVPLGTPLLRERRLTLDRDGNRLEFSDDRYRPELSSFTIENRVEHPTPLARTYHLGE